MVRLSTFLALFSRLSLFNFQGPVRVALRDSLYSISYSVPFVKRFLKVFQVFFSTFCSSGLFSSFSEVSAHPNSRRLLPCGTSSCGAYIYYHIRRELSRGLASFFEFLFDISRFFAFYLQKKSRGRSIQQHFSTALMSQQCDQKERDDRHKHGRRQKHTPELVQRIACFGKHP